MCVALHCRIAPEVVFQTRVVAEQSFRVESQGGGPACRRTQSVMGPYWEIARTALGVSRGPRECLVISTRGFVIVWRTFIERLTDSGITLLQVWFPCQHTDTGSE